MLENVNKIYAKAKEQNVDLSIAWAMVRNEDRLAGVTDHTDLDKAWKVVNGYQSTISKMIVAGDEEALKNLLENIEAGNNAEVVKIIESWNLK